MDDSNNAEVITSTIIKVPPPKDLRTREQRDADRQAKKQKERAEAHNLKKFSSIMLSVSLSCERLAEMNPPKFKPTERVQAIRDLAKSSELIAKMIKLLCKLPKDQADDK